MATTYADLQSIQESSRGIGEALSAIPTINLHNQGQALENKTRQIANDEYYRRRAQEMTDDDTVAGMIGILNDPKNEDPKQKWSAMAKYIQTRPPSIRSQQFYTTLVNQDIARERSRITKPQFKPEFTTAEDGTIMQRYVDQTGQYASGEWGVAPNQELARQKLNETITHNANTEATNAKKAETDAAYKAILGAKAKVQTNQIESLTPAKIKALNAIANKNISGTRQIKISIINGKPHLVSIDLLNNDPANTVDMGETIGHTERGIVIKRKEGDKSYNVLVDPETGNDIRNMGEAVDVGTSFNFSSDDSGTKPTQSKPTVTGQVEKRKAGESIEDYLKRTGQK